MEDSKKMVRLAAAALEEKKGENITVIDIHDVSVLADYFIIADGGNASQVQAMVCKQIEGYQNAGWILMDYGDVIVHVFSREDRLFYDLERIWRDGKTIVDLSEL